MSATVVSLHAHPDDEVLLTGGTLAQAVQDGHRVVLLVATDGANGLTGTDGADLGARRLEELAASARCLGITDVRCLGYGDSGMNAEFDGFAALDTEVAAVAVAAVLTEVGAEVLTTYDARGGYGHPDHIQVHRVGARAAQLAGVDTVLQATVDRTSLVRVVRLLARVRLLPGSIPVGAFDQAYTARAEITHRIDVRGQARRKRAAMRAHASQATGGDSARTLALLGRLPLPLFRRVCGTEWFTMSSRTAGVTPATAIVPPAVPDRPADPGARPQ